MSKLRELIARAEYPVALTGAGISAPSGIPTFQGSWKGKPLRDLLTRSYFARNPVAFFELYSNMVGWCDKQPNIAHLALSELNVRVITQNIDGLHAKAGSRDALEMHGSLRFVVCPRCGYQENSRSFADRFNAALAVSEKDALKVTRCPECGAAIDTDVVLYSDAVRHLDEAVLLAQKSDLFLVIGTSLVTYPAAELPEIARASGSRIVMINDDCISAFSE